MSTRHLIAPDLLPLIDVQAAVPLSLQSLGELRKAGEVRQAGLPATGVDPQLRHASGMNGAPEVPLLHYRPVDQTPASAAVLHCHGGGMISGSASITACSSAASALDAGLPVFSVEYRLAPEVAFPGQLEDCHAVFVWMVDNAEILGIDPFRIAVCGDSAGGGLAASLALFERDLGECQPVAQVLTYPMLDCRTGGPDDPYLETATGEFCWTRAQNCFAWAALQETCLPDNSQLGWFSPALAGDLGGLPPAWIGVGELDLFHGECRAYSDRLREAGVTTSLHVYRGAPHGFNAVPSAKTTQRYRADLDVAFAAIAMGRSW